MQMDRIRLELDAHLLQCEASLNRRIRHYEDRFNAALRCATCVVLPRLHCGLLVEHAAAAMCAA